MTIELISPRSPAVAIHSHSKRASQQLQPAVATVHKRQIHKRSMPQPAHRTKHTNQLGTKGKCNRCERCKDTSLNHITTGKLHGAAWPHARTPDRPLRTGRSGRSRNRTSEVRRAVRPPTSQCFVLPPPSARLDPRLKPFKCTGIHEKEKPIHDKGLGWVTFERNRQQHCQLILQPAFAVQTFCLATRPRFISDHKAIPVNFEWHCFAGIWLRSAKPIQQQ